MQIGTGSPALGAVTPGNPRSANNTIPRPVRSLDRARSLLKGAGISWTKRSIWRRGASGCSRESSGFSILTSPSNTDRKMATLIQYDLKQLGIRVQAVPLELRSLTRNPTPISTFGSRARGIIPGTLQSHILRPLGKLIDKLMEQQLATPCEQRRRLYERIQEIIAEGQPMIFLANPDILAVAKMLNLVYPYRKYCLSSKTCGKKNRCQVKLWWDLPLNTAV
jgi:ABC-type transport system substrate-binding protein